MQAAVPAIVKQPLRAIAATRGSTPHTPTNPRLRPNSATVDAPLVHILPGQVQIRQLAPRLRNDPQRTAACGLRRLAVVWSWTEAESALVSNVHCDW